LYFCMRQLNAFTGFRILFWTSWSAVYSSPNRSVFLFNPSHLSSPCRFVCPFCVSTLPSLCSFVFMFYRIHLSPPYRFVFVRCVTHLSLPVPHFVRSWIFRSCGMWCCVFGQVVPWPAPMFLDCLALTMKELQSYELSESTSPVTHGRMPEDFIC
jgi:hypothetical protein